MSNNLVLECFSEEISAKEQNEAINYLVKNFTKLINKYGLSFEKIYGYYTVMRLSLIVYDISVNYDEFPYIKGPVEESNHQSIDGFVRKYGANVSDLEIIDDNGRRFYVLKKIKIDIQKIVKEVLQSILKSIPWKKQMKWGDYKLKWSRPIHAILCCMENSALTINLEHIVSGNMVSGHKTLSNIKKNIVSVKEYLDFLDKNFVVLNQEQRILSFKNALEKVLESEKLFVNVDLIEVSEIALGVEFPNLICVDLDKTLMLSLPNIITVNVIEKYGFIALYNDSGVLSNKVVTVINVKPSDVIVNGYRQMIEARLMDALHAWRYSMSVDVEALEGRLSKMLFYNSLGTVAEKIHRITVLAKYLTIWIPHVNIIEVEKAARLSKLDLTMEIVNEFPSLQGEIGAIYAKNNGASDLVSDAIREHYLPHGMSGPMPMTAEGITLSIADKLDTIVGFFIINKIPTSSQDPLGLRRAVLSIIRTTIHHNIDVPFSIVVYKAIQNYPRSLYKTRFHTKIIETIALIAHKKHDSEESHSNDISYIRKSVIEFFKERFISVISSEYSISSDIALSVLNVDHRCSFIKTINDVILFKDFLDTKNGQMIMLCYKRMLNITSQLSKDNSQQNVSQSSFVLQDEVDLFEKIKSKKSSVEKKRKINIKDALEDIIVFAEQINYFLDNNVVNDKDEEIRYNRIGLLQKAMSIFNLILDFNVLMLRGKGD